MVGYSLYKLFHPQSQENDASKREKHLFREELSQKTKKILSIEGENRDNAAINDDKLEKSRSALEQSDARLTQALKVNEPFSKPIQDSHPLRLRFCLK